MKILAIESSCDETAAAVVERKNNEPVVSVLSNVIATSLDIHATTGGIIPENAAREQVKYIIPVIIEALLKSENIEASSAEDNFKNAKNILAKKIDAIAVTYGPGLVGSLLIGVETAKTVSLTFNKPLVPVNHLLAHLFANFIQSTTISHKLSAISFPLIGLIVSGGHTDLLFFDSLTKYKWLGGTRDDAAGEALDKIGRLLNLSYPAGPEIENRANEFLKLNPNRQLLNAKFHSPMIGSKDFDFSFSGLKAEVARFVEKNNNMDEKIKNEICFAVQKAIIDVLVKKTVRAAKMYNCETILVGGGVSANQTLLEELKLTTKSQIPNANILSPEKRFSTDNAAMIGAYALMDYSPRDWQKVTSTPDLYFD